MRDYRQQTAGLRGAAKGLREIDMPETAEQMDDAADAIEELLAFAKFVAREAIDTGDNDGVSAEILCRKLNKLGLIETDVEFWMLPTPPKGGNHDN